MFLYYCGIMGSLHQLIRNLLSVHFRPVSLLQPSSFWYIENCSVVENLLIGKDSGFVSTCCSLASQMTPPCETKCATMWPK